MGTIFTRRFEADRIGSQVPIKLMHLEGLYELFVSKFAYSSLDISVHLFEVQFAMKLTYRTLPFDDDELIRGADAYPEKSFRLRPNDVRIPPNNKEIKTIADAAEILGILL